MTASAAPKLEGDALAAVTHRSSHMQIIASAGSGKTEVVAQRVADLIASDVDPAGIVAFTFTERAARELKARISARVEERLGTATLDRLGACFVGTIHAYCFRLLQQHVPRYETYDVLDDNRLTAFLCREATRLDIKAIDGKLFSSIRVFLANLAVVENELIPTSELADPFKQVVERFDASTEQYRLLTYGQQVLRAVEALEDPSVAAVVHRDLRHLIVDEYQDVNPAQEKLIQLMTGPDVELCVVGDDDQAIYQWRGSDVRNIVHFTERYAGVHTFRITTNRRSRPAIVGAAAKFVESIPGRLPKVMAAVREPAAPEIVKWAADTEAEETELIAATIERLHQQGRRYRDIAVLVRTRAVYPELLTALEQRGIPVQPAGRTGLFARPEAQLLGMTYSWLVDHEWTPESFKRGTIPSDQDVFDGFGSEFRPTPERQLAIRHRLFALKGSVSSAERPVNLIADFYDLLADAGTSDWDLDDPVVVSRLGTLARFSAILADYESVRRRSRPDKDNPGEQVGGQDRGEWYYKNLAIHLANYAKGAYEDFDGEPDVAVDAVDLTTVHQAKGLEWPVVFVPSLTARRFPSGRTGQAGDWRVPTHLFDTSRYEGTDADERRLFYVAMTRARDWLSLSRHERIKNRVKPSPYHLEVDAPSPISARLPLPAFNGDGGGDEAEPVVLTFSELAAYRDCGLAYRMRTLLGFQPTLAPELGYGKAVHHVMRSVAEHTQQHGQPPAGHQLDQLFDQDFFLPSANKAAHREMKRAARRLVDNYIKKYPDDLQRVWETERPFELHLPDAVISGRADVILDKEDGVVSALAIVDYKTSIDPREQNGGMQLAVYTDAGRREGLDVRAAYLHDLRAAERHAVDVSIAALADAEESVGESVQALRERQFEPQPGHSCTRCDVRKLCRWSRAT